MKKKSFIILPIITIVIGFSLLYRILLQVEDQTLELAVKMEAVYAKQAAKSIEAFFQFYENSLKLLSEADVIVNFSRDNKTIYNSAKSRMRVLYTNHQKYIKGITRVDKSGKVLYTYPENKNVIGLDVAYQEHNALIIRQQKPIISDVFETLQGYQAIVFAYPIFKDGEYDGCISVLFPFEIIAKDYVENISITEGSYAFLLSEKGIELYCPFEEHIGRSIFETAAEYPTVIEMSKKILKREIGIAEYLFPLKNNNDIKYVEKVAAYHPVSLKNTFWTIVVTMPKDVILANTIIFKTNLFITLFLTSFTIFVILIFYNISKKKNLKYIEESEVKHRSIAEQTGQLIYEFEMNSRIIKFSGSIKEITGYEEAEFAICKIEKWEQLIHTDDRAKVLEHFNDTIEKLSKFYAVYRFMKKDGSFIYVEDNGIFKQNLKSNEILMLGTMKDITPRIEAEKELISHRNELEHLVARRTRELKMANEELIIDIKKRKKAERALLEAKEKAEKSDTLKSEFLAQISHEIRTPINVILNYSSLIRYEFEDDLSSELEGSFDSIDNAAARLLRTIDLILNMSEIETGSFEPNKELVELSGEIINPLVLEASQLVKGKGLEIIVNDDADKNNLLLIDRYAATQIIENLINNAIKYTESGHIEIRIYNDTQYYMVEVNDTGIGIADEYLPMLFSKFSQEEQGYTRRFEGNGLGLAIVKEYCKINNATIDVESEKGVGTSFKVTFPI